MALKHIYYEHAGVHVSHHDSSLEPSHPVTCSASDTLFIVKKTYKNGERSSARMIKQKQKAGWHIKISHFVVPASAVHILYILTFLIS